MIEEQLEYCKTTIKELDDQQHVYFDRVDDITNLSKKKLDKFIKKGMIKKDSPKRK